MIDPSQVVPKMAHRIARLGPGSAAALRRGPTRGAGAAAYWQLVAPLEGERQWGENQAWATVIQSMAILTPRGQEPDKQSCHNPAVAMGAALYNSGFSELRLAHMLGAPPATRQHLIVRAARRLAGSEHARFNLSTLARFALARRTERPAQQIAKEYYRAEAMARRSNTNSREEPTT